MFLAQDAFWIAHQQVHAWFSPFNGGGEYSSVFSHHITCSHDDSQQAAGAICPQEKCATYSQWGHLERRRFDTCIVAAPFWTQMLSYYTGQPRGSRKTDPGGHWLQKYFVFTPTQCTCLSSCPWSSPTKISSIYLPRTANLNLKQSAAFTLLRKASHTLKMATTCHRCHSTEHEVKDCPKRHQTTPPPPWTSEPWESNYV